MLFDVRAFAARQVIYHAHLRLALHQSVDQVRPDKRCTAGYQYFLTIPDDCLHDYYDDLRLLL